ncbi:hypothetical protein DASC09_058450 [Saccharomycopsis crataegensis]|uniref:Uncharacterized protein n=1 Tax=Saccharomycopsis crataegensis TaxID=43959 RepID=A0AAV5QVF9_9ASCO|nr:hypothetical protein DASC09_058450 [Saccharomycopsis crataegensis]
MAPTSSTEILMAQDSPIKRRRGRPLKARNDNLSNSKIKKATCLKVARSSAAVLKAGSPNHRSPTMKVSPTAQKLKAVLALQNHGLSLSTPKPKGGSILSFGSDHKKKWTPITRRLFEIGGTAEIESHNSDKKSHQGKILIQKQENDEDRSFLNFRNSVIARNQREKENYRVSHLHEVVNPLDNHGLIDPNSLLSSPMFSGTKNPDFSRASNLLNGDFFSSPIVSSRHQQHNDVNLVTSPTGLPTSPSTLTINNDHHHRLLHDDHINLQVDHEQTLQHQQNHNETLIAADITCSPAAGFNFSSIIQSSPVFHGYYMKTPTSASSSRNNTKISVRAMEIKPSPSQMRGSGEPEIEDDSDLEFAHPPRCKANVDGESNDEAPGPLLPPVTISNLEFSSDEEDDDFPEKYLINHNRPVVNTSGISLTVDSSGRAIISRPPTTALPVAFPHNNLAFGSDTIRRTINKTTPSLMSSPRYDTQNNRHFLPSSPFPAIAMAEDFFARPSNPTTDETLETNSEIEESDGKLGQQKLHRPHIIHNPVFATNIPTKTMIPAFGNGVKLDASFMSDDSIDENGAGDCDARAALMKMVGMRG